jgi:hypothetical protein
MPALKLCYKEAFGEEDPLLEASPQRCLAPVRMIGGLHRPAEVEQPVKRRRGRPPKNAASKQKKQTLEEEAEEEVYEVEAIKGMRMTKVSHSWPVFLYFL